MNKLENSSRVRSSLTLSARRDWSQPRQTGSLHSARPSWPWLRSIRPHSFQTK